MRVSVIIPYKVDRGYLQEAIDSVKKQTYPDVQLILSNSINGVSHNINKGVELATGEFVKFLSDDDTLPPDAIKFLVASMGDSDFIHGNANNFKSRLSGTLHVPAVKTPTLPELLSHNHIHGGTTMYRTDVWERFGRFDESLWTGEELDFHLMLLSKGAKIGYCNNVVYNYRKHSGQKSDSKHKTLRIPEIKKIRDRYR